MGWQNTLAGTPTTTAAYADDGAGQRVAQAVTTNGSTTTTDYLAGGLEAVTTSGSPATTTLTKYETVPGVGGVVIVGSGPSETISYVTTDGLGSVSEALDGSGNVTAQQLYGPYGTGRYSSGTMPTAKGYTGQYGDATTGLDYYGARSYDPLVGQFTSADTAGDGLNRYAYVHDDPETYTDPTGQMCTASDRFGARCGTGGGGGGCTTNCSGTPPCIASCKSPCWPHCSPPKQPPSGPGSPCGGCNVRQGPQQPDTCDSTCHAKQVAHDVSSELTGIGLAAGAAALIISLLMMTPEALPFLPLLAFLAAALGSLGTIAGIMAAKFNDFGSHEDPAFYSLSSVDAFATDLGHTMLAFVAVMVSVITVISKLPSVIAQAITAGLIVGGLGGGGWIASIALDGIIKLDNILGPVSSSSSADVKYQGRS